MVKVEIINGPIDFFSLNDNRDQDGAEIVFNGRVRAAEYDKIITALEYEQYEDMAESELKKIADISNEYKKYISQILWQRMAMDGIMATGRILTIPIIFRQKN